MYTKTLLLALLLIILPCLISSGNAKKEIAHRSLSVGSNMQTIQPEKNESSDSLIWNFTLGNEDINKGSHHGEEDGKHHHFHFTRIQKRRSKRTWHIVLKSILLIVHVAGLLAAFFQVMH